MSRAAASAVIQARTARYIMHPPGWWLSWHSTGLSRRAVSFEVTVKITWVYDVISPFAYLSLKQLPQLPQGTQVEFVPVLFAGLLNHFGQVGPAEIVSKRRFTYRFALWR